MSGAANAADRVLKVTNWAEYIGEETIANFEAEYGIKVIYDTYDSAESIDAKLLAGDSGYDVVSHSGSMVARLIQAHCCAIRFVQAWKCKQHGPGNYGAIGKRLGSWEQTLYSVYVGNTWSYLQ